MDRDSVFIINIYDTREGSVTAENFASLSEGESMGICLSGIRNLLIENGGLYGRKAGYPFCDSKGARFPDITPFSKYCEILQQLQEGSKTESKLSSAVKYVGTFWNCRNPVYNPVYNVYLRREEDESQCLSNGTSKDTQVAGMSVQDWEVVLHHTSYLNGYRKVFTNIGGTPTLQRFEQAPYRAFDLGERLYEPLDISNNPFVVVDREVKVPRFVVKDDAYIDVFESEGTVSESMARNGFAKNEFKLLTEGGAFGFGAALGGNFATTKSETQKEGSKKENTLINVTYNYPRIVLDLNSDDLRLSDECKRDLNRINECQTDEEKFEKLRQFHLKFGDYFFTHIELGGRLYSSKKLSAFETDNVDLAASTFKGAAEASISASFAKGSAAYGRETGTSTVNERNTRDSNMSIVWQAQGGDTLLCNNPSAWSSTVSPFQNWRAIRQEDFSLMVDMISKFPEYQDTRTKFAAIEASNRWPSNISFKLKVLQGPLKGKYLTLVRDIPQEKLINLIRTSRPRRWPRRWRRAALKDEVRDRMQQLSFADGETCSLFTIRVEHYRDMTAQIHYNVGYKITTSQNRSNGFICLAPTVRQDKNAIQFCEFELPTRFSFTNYGLPERSMENIGNESQVVLEVFDEGLRVGQMESKGFATTVDGCFVGVAEKSKGDKLILQIVDKFVIRA